MPENNFTILRLILATLVVIGHFKVLAGLPSAYSIHGYADFAVDAFFIISGYLVYGSFANSPQLKGFYIKRFFRIYPLFAFMILVQTLAMIYLLDGKAQASDIASYLGYNLIFATFMQNDIGGLLSGLNTDGINPSLWTLKIEAAFYAIVPLIFWLTRRFGLWILAAIFIASTAYYAVCDYYALASLAKQLPAQMRFFVVGIFLYIYCNPALVAGAARYKNGVTMAIIAIMLFAIITLRFDLPLMVIYPLIVGAFVYIVALLLPALTLKYDISYGVYLIHAPLIQIALLLGYYSDSMLFLLSLLGVVFSLAFLAEKFIELPMIKLGKKLSKKYGE